MPKMNEGILHERPDTMNKILTHPLYGSITFLFITILSAKVTIPLQPVPITLQSMAVVLSGAFLGARMGFATQVSYLLLGAVGLPVFAISPLNGEGFARLIGPTGGYLIAFPVAAYITGKLLELNKSNFHVSLSFFIANFTILLFGSIHLSLFFFHNFYEAITSGFIFFLLTTVVKVAASVGIYFSIRKFASK